MAEFYHWSLEGSECGAIGTVHILSLAVVETTMPGDECRTYISDNRPGGRMELRFTPDWDKFIAARCGLSEEPQWWTLRDRTGKGTTSHPGYFLWSTPTRCHGETSQYDAAILLTGPCISGEPPKVGD